MHEITWIPFSKTYLRNYQDFARKYYGDDAYQAKEDYINWLYRENPLSSDENDFLIGVHTERNILVGCIHKMQMKWAINGKTFSMPALHNLIVDEEHRHGIGFMLVMAAVAGEEQAHMPGVEEPFSNFYKTLKYQKINAHWYRKLLKPISASFLLVTKKMIDRKGSATYFDPEAMIKIDGNYKVEFSPNKDLLQQIASSLNEKNKDTYAPFWTEEQIKWRFFHPIGPRSILIYENFQDSIKNFAIVSMGPRKGLNISRILALKSSSEQSLDKLLKNIFNLLSDQGSHLIQLVSADKNLNNSLKSIGWNHLKDSPDTYFYHRNRNQRFADYSFTGSAGDFGFEAIK